MSKRAMTLPKSVDAARTRFDEAVRENLQIITGQRGDRLAELPSTATQAEIIDKLNEIIRCLQ